MSLKFTYTLSNYQWSDIQIDPNFKVPLGRGSFGIVLKGSLVKFNRRPVAIKLITKSLCWAQQRTYEEEKNVLLREGEIIKSANGYDVANIVRVHGIVDGELPKAFLSSLNIPVADNELSTGIVLEYFDGQSLFSLLHGKLDDISFPVSTLSLKKEENDPLVPLSLLEKIFILKEISSALADLHFLGIIHGDIKSSNILISTHNPPLVKIIDFGLSAIRENLEDILMGQSTLHFTAHGKGTPIYCAPGRVFFVSLISFSLLCLLRNPESCGTCYCFTIY
jgi:serine/threonine protein kinase